MNKIEVKLTSFRAIKTAKIALDGITVISGVNGSGKSTISRLLYCAVNTMCNFESKVLNDAKRDILSLIGRYTPILRQTQSALGKSYTDSDENLIKDAGSFEELQETVDVVVGNILTKLPPAMSDRYLTYLRIELGSGESSSDAVTRHITETGLACGDIITSAREIAAEMPKRNLFDFIRRSNSDLEDFSGNYFQFVENGENLIGKDTFTQPISLTSAIYVDTPMALNANLNWSNPNWSRLTDLMIKDLGRTITKEASSIIEDINKLIHGRVVVESSGSRNSLTRLVFEREDGLRIRLENAATGFKSFAYVMRLLSNGELNSSSLLVIDEPEAHLHPQWVVEFARILVRLHKEMGIRLMVTSHSTDMVLAIQRIADEEGCIDRTRFYLAESADEYRYNYVDLGSDVERIFECFNKSLEKIEEYGGGSLV
ncbi:MAG: AAA family ATPase [Bacteroidales bacterium]|nr:AAA family ATPase [Bacteroidales bacterium]